MLDPNVVKRVNELRIAGPNALVTVMLDGRPDRAERMVVRETCVNLDADDDQEVFAECTCTDLELHSWTVDVRFLASVG
jgi:hypothetical protein